jgi:hypothetical protein
MSPAEMLYGRKLRTQLDLLVPSVKKNVRNAQDRQKRNHDTHCQPQLFALGESVYVKNYSSGPRWLPGKIVGTEGSVLYQIQLSDGRTVRRHADQLRSRVADIESHSPADDDTGDSFVPIELDGGIGEDQETETQQAVPENQETQSTEAATPITTDTALPAPVITPAQEPNSNERQESVEESHSTPRRSTRNKHTPVRFEEQSY